MTKDKLILWSPILVVLVLSLVLLWWDYNERQAHTQIETLMETWESEHCTSNSDSSCGRLQ